MNTLDSWYQYLCKCILDRGNIKSDRTGTGTRSLFGFQFKHNMKNGFPLLTTKKIHFKSVVTELKWFLRGETNIRNLVLAGCNIWNGDAYKNYCKYTSQNNPVHDEWMRDNGDGTLSMYTADEFIDKIKLDKVFADKWGDLGPIYGKQWKSWSAIDNSEMRMTTYPIDQIANLIKDLKENPDSRRLMVNAWNVADLSSMVLPPCHYGFQCYTRDLTKDERFRYWDDVLGGDDSKLGTNLIPKKALSLMWNQRSVDVGLGLPFNIASYGLLLEMLAKEVNMVPDKLIGSFGDCHIYNNHVEGITEQLSRVGHELPKIKITDSLVMPTVGNFDQYDVELINYIADPTIKLPLSN